MIRSWSNPQIQSLGYEGSTVNLYVDFQPHGIGAPNPRVVQGSAVVTYGSVT